MLEAGDPVHYVLEIFVLSGWSDMIAKQKT